MKREELKMLQHAVGVIVNRKAVQDWHASVTSQCLHQAVALQPAIEE